MNLSKQESIALRNLVSGDNEAFYALEKFANSMIDEWKEENIIGNTEYDTIRMAIRREAKVEALREFIKKLDEIE